MLENCRKLDDSTLLKNLEHLAANERETGVSIILHLIEVKKRKLYIGLGHDGLFSYCVERLHFSKSTAYRRKIVVDRAEQFPELLARLADGRLSLCAAAAVANHLTDATAAMVLDAVTGLSYREVESHLLKRAAKSPVTVQAPPSQDSLVTAPCDRLAFDGEFALPIQNEFNAEPNKQADEKPAPVHPRTIVRPLTAETSRINVTASDATVEKLKRAREILRGQSDDEILNRALDLLLEKKAPERRHARRVAAEKRKTKAAAVDTASSKNSGIETTDAAAMFEKQPRPRQAPLADRDRAHVEAGGQCAFVAADGHRCQARTFLDSDHVVPYARGGASNYGNTRVLCHLHNLYEAANIFGPWHQAQAPQSQNKAPDKFGLS